MSCRIVIKMPRNFKPDTAPVCSRCQSHVFFAGKAFRAPKRSDEKGWRKVALMLRAGYVFHSAHLGRVPDNPNALADWVDNRRKLAQEGKQWDKKYDSEERWKQLQRAADWRATEKRRREEERKNREADAEM